MTPTAITGWKTHLAAAMLLVSGIGLVLTERHFFEGLKWILIGAAFIGLRNAMAKVLREIDSDRKAVSDLRAAIEAELTKGRSS